MIRFEPRTEAAPALRVAAPVASISAALALAAVPLAFAGAPILTAFRLMGEGAAGSIFALTETLTRATPLILTGLAAAVAFRARLYNIGAEGQLYAGALAAVAVGSGAVEAPPAVLVPLILAAAALAGALLMLGPALLKVRLGIDEVVTTLLLNFVVLLFVQMMLEGPLKDPMGGGWPQSEPITDAGMLPPLVERMRLHAGFLVATRGEFLGAGRPVPHSARAEDQSGRREPGRGALCRDRCRGRHGGGCCDLRRARRDRRSLGGRGAERVSHFGPFTAASATPASW